MSKITIDTLKMLGVQMVNKANSGHPGIVLGASTITNTLFTKHINYDVNDTKWINRDRFILSAGHGSALLYAHLRLMNLISDEDMKNFRQLGSITPGHPEFGMTPGVEATTGPLGQGVAMAVGMALAESHISAKFPEVDHYTYAVLGDGDFQEGVAMEALSFAGHYKLNKLILIHDSNDIQLDSEVSAVNTENIENKVKSMGFNYILVKSNEESKIDAAIIKAKSSKEPSFIEVKTIIGDGTPKQGTSAVHGSPLGGEISELKENLGWTLGDFEIPEEAFQEYNDSIIARGKEAHDNWQASPELIEFLTKKEKIELKMTISKDNATRNSSGEVIKYLNNNVSNWIGGSADLTGSTKAIGGDGIYTPENRNNRNILFGVREFAMGAIGNGMALHSNLRPFVSTFYVFSDYLKPAMRLSALMSLPVTYIFTHDSVFVGEDGPTHQPIEQNAMIRSIPNMSFFRPADEKEVIGAYEYAINANGPSTIVLTRQNIKSLDETDIYEVQKGLYYLHKTDSPFTIVASGSELANALEIGKSLNINVVSISNFKGDATWDITKAISIEAATTFGLGKYAVHNIGINSFGESGPGSQVYKHFKLDKDSLISTIKNTFNI